jgi:hypothetical protein
VSDSEDDERGAERPGDETAVADDGREFCGPVGPDPGVAEEGDPERRALDDVTGAQQSVGADAVPECGRRPREDEECAGDEEQ